MVKDVVEAGFAVIPRVVGQEDCHQLLDGLSDVRKSRAGARHLLSHPLIQGLAARSTLQTIASDVLESEAVPFRVTLFDKSAESNWAVVWHQDTALPLRNRFDAPGWGPWSVKAGITYAHAPAEALERIVAIRLHLDDSLESNGPLRVLPGTHRLGVLSDEAVSEIARRSNPISCLVPRCGVLVMRPLLIHSSSKSTDSPRRRVLHIEYASSAFILPNIALAVA